MEDDFIDGFSKLTKQQKIEALSKSTGYTNLSELLASFWHMSDQQLFDEFSENTLSNYYLPFSIAPNFLVNNKIYHIPFVTEESSVVAAASAAAKFWFQNGGFHAEVISAKKSGQVHFFFNGHKEIIFGHWSEIKRFIYNNIKSINSNMESRGGGVLDIHLKDCTSLIRDYYQISIVFDTIDSMGANFINTILEQTAVTLTDYCSRNLHNQANCEILMSILSNYSPECKVKCSVEAPVSVFNNIPGLAEKFVLAVSVAKSDIYRCVTHNKGIMNGIDAVLLATGNDFRAVEADVHAYASSEGKYTSLSEVSVTDGIFNLTVELPLTVGTVGGVTTHHPLASVSLDILGNPSARQLMMIIASAGLASHFSAIKALITDGIQKGHMRMHLSNILQQLNASEIEKTEIVRWFKDKTVSFNEVSLFLNKIRSKG